MLKIREIVYSEATKQLNLKAWSLQYCDLCQMIITDCHAQFLQDFGCFTVSTSDFHVTTLRVLDKGACILKEEGKKKQILCAADIFTLKN